MSVGYACPPINDLTFVKGSPFVLGGPRREDLTGAIVIVEFWATWCPPCLESIKHMSRLSQMYRDRGVLVLGITYERHLQNVVQFVREHFHEMDYTVAHDPNRSARQGLFIPSQAKGIPKTFLVVDNHVVWHGHPTDEALEGHLEKAIAWRQAQIMN